MIAAIVKIAEAIDGIEPDPIPAIVIVIVIAVIVTIAAIINSGESI